MIRSSVNYSNLYLFQIVAKCLSFTQAGSALGITQAAVSHRIKNLEEEVGCKLFVRWVRSITLTPEGSELFDSVSSSFGRVDTVIDEIRNPIPRGEIRVGTSPHFAVNILIPRLGSFIKAYPELTVRLVTSYDSQRFDDESMDLAIVYDLPTIDFYCEELGSEQILPICTLAYAQEHHLLDEGTSLSGVTLIKNSHSSDWQQWLTKQKPPIQECKEFIVDEWTSALVAAQSGLGVAIGRYTAVKEKLETGELVAPFKRVTTDKSYWLVTVPGMENRDKFRLFSDWLKESVFE